MTSNQEVISELRRIRDDIGEVRISFATHCEQSVTRDRAIKTIMDDLYGNGKPSIVVWARHQMKKIENAVEDTRKIAVSWKSGIFLFICTITISTIVGLVVNRLGQ
jgi:hypothetical protein